MGFFIYFAVYFTNTMHANLKDIYKLFLRHPVISTDSRNISPGCLFFALKGESFNGNTFAAEALCLGAAHSIIDEKKYATNDRCILVDDVLTTLQQLALHHRRQIDIPVIGVTGTNGKTTTKELIHSVLSGRFRTVATKGNLNNHIGVPLTLLSITPETEMAIIEMGANHPGEIDFLCRLALPGFGLITNIGKAHLEGFGGLEGVIRTKTELYRFIRSGNGKIFLNSDNPLLKEHASGICSITYGSPPADLSMIRASANPFVWLNILFNDQTELKVTTKLYGKYNAENILAAACIGQYFGIEPEHIKNALEAYVPANNRSQFTKTTRNNLIMDAYNANPSSMRTALLAFSEVTSPKKAVILGDMLELGDEGDREHQYILSLLEELHPDEVFLVGSVFSRLNKRREWYCFQDSDLARMWLGHHPLKDHTILIKGSRGIRLEKVLEML